MTHAIYRVTTVEMVRPFTLRVGFNDGVQQVIDFQPVLVGELYRPLRDPALFSQVKIDPDAHTIVWPNGADFDPETLHDWPKYVDALTARARQWASMPVAM